MTEGLLRELAALAADFERSKERGEHEVERDGARAPAVFAASGDDLSGSFRSWSRADGIGALLRF